MSFVTFIDLYNGMTSGWLKATCLKTNYYVPFKKYYMNRK